MSAPVTGPIAIGALDLAALLCSRVCHDLISSVGAVVNGIEVLEEDKDEETKVFALDLIKKSAHQASAKLQFCRLAFGAAGSAGAQIDLATAEQITRGLLGHGKHRLNWRGIKGHMAKDKVKLLLNLISAALTTLPRGGEIDVLIAGSLERPSFLLRCRGTAARPPQYLTDYVNGGAAPQLDALSIQAYYTWRLAVSGKMRLEIVKDGPDVVLSARAAG